MRFARRRRDNADGDHALIYAVEFILVEIEDSGLLSRGKGDELCAAHGTRMEGGYGKASRFPGNCIVGSRLILDIGDNCIPIWRIARMDGTTCRVGNIYRYSGMDYEAR